MKEIIKKLRQYDIRIRKAINSHMQGDFHSVFKGSGLEFDDVREYQYGDDVRSIDWNVSAKGHGTFIKTYKEEKEQTVFFLLDVSASQEIGTSGHQKIDVAKEICGVLSLSAVRESSQVGVLAYSDQKEIYIPPGKGMSHAYHIINRIFKNKAQSRETDITGMLSFAMNMIKRRSVIILISDFIDEDYEKNLRALAKLHDLVVIHLSDKRESQIPNLGIVPLYDKESGKTLWVNSSSSGFGKNTANYFHENKEKIMHLCRRYQANYLQLDTGQEYVGQLIKLFKVRNRMKKKA
ncbi:DUF58 domain-containing protein [Hyphobacterium sp. CCMP332]|nr:DUF58 domain-containing protein [Hyphobacterium sp. CCMP332]